MNKIRTLLPWIKQRNIINPMINKAHNCYIYEKNKKIVDFTSGLMVVNLGHNNKYIYEGFNKHMNTGIGYLPSSFSTYERDKLSSRLIDISNLRNGRVFYTNAGADANESAIFFSLEYSSYINQEVKTRVLSFKNSFHGGSSIVSSLIGGDERKIRKELYYDTKNLNLEAILTNPIISDNGLSSLNQIEIEFKKGNVCSILLEGSSGSAGIYLYPENYLKKIRTLCDKYNVILICDEVMSGFGRTGTFFAYQNKEQNILPDIVTCAKGLTSGYAPLGAVIINNKISDYFDDNICYNGLTYFGHTLSCTIANRCLDLYLKNDMEIINNVNYKSIILENLAKMYKNNNNLIKDYRTNGFLGCFELNTNESQMNIIKNNLYNNNIFCFSRGNFIFTAPPLIIDNDLLIDTMNKINKCIKI